MQFNCKRRIKGLTPKLWETLKAVSYSYLYGDFLGTTCAAQVNFSGPWENTLT